LLSGRNRIAPRFISYNFLSPLAREGVWYLFVLPEFITAVMVNIPVLPQSVKLIQSDKTIPYSYRDGVLAIIIPKELRTEMDDVIKIIL
jgi:hypothetical protein